ncbi:hypothetical protein MM1218R_03650 [Mycobacterium marinum]|nr:hypothetical protein MM1218R_03650 [Mycobacterium marinum]RFZ10773.1 hypothetical protein DE4381_01426 [Mycobacterium marinum]RFZ22598.1 hypothetical protein VIMS_00007 [Mycobacterium marinum]
MSGELQGSVIVERRGNPQTYGELVDYLRCAIRVLQSMVGDPDSGVGEVAEKAAIHPILETEAVRDTLFEALASLPDDALRKSALRSSTGMRCSPMLRSRNIGAATKSEPDVAGRRAGLDARLPAAAPAEEPASLAYTRQSPNGEQC